MICLLNSISTMLYQDLIYNWNLVIILQLIAKITTHRIYDEMKGMKLATISHSSFRILRTTCEDVTFTVQNVAHCPRWRSPFWSADSWNAFAKVQLRLYFTAIGHPETGMSYFWTSHPHCTWACQFYQPTVKCKGKLECRVFSFWQIT